MKRFNHVACEIEQLERISENGLRWYQTQDKRRFPSVTSVTSFAGKESIENWRNSIGHEAADLISARASSRGTEIHSYAEDYLNNKQVIPDMFNQELWNNFVPLLNRIDNIHGNELMLYSNIFEVAGTADCICEFDGILSIVDFKTARKLKNKEDIINYFQQCAFYAMSYREMTGISVNQIVVLIAVDDYPPQIFIENTIDWLSSAKTCRENFRQSTGL